MPHHRLPPRPVTLLRVSSQAGGWLLAGHRGFTTRYVPEFLFPSVATARAHSARHADCSAYAIARADLVVRWQRTSDINAQGAYLLRTPRLIGYLPAGECDAPPPLFMAWGPRARQQAVADVAAAMARPPFDRWYRAIGCPAVQPYWVETLDQVRWWIRQQRRLDPAAAFDVVTRAGSEPPDSADCHGDPVEP